MLTVTSPASSGREWAAPRILLPTLGGTDSLQWGMSSGKCILPWTALEPGRDVDQHFTAAVTCQPSDRSGNIAAVRRRCPLGGAGIAPTGAVPLVESVIYLLILPPRGCIREACCGLCVIKTIFFPFEGHLRERRRLGERKRERGRFVIYLY